MTTWNKVIATYVALILGGTLVLASHVLTMRSVSDDLERWRSLGYTLTQTAEQCVALLPSSWIADRVARLRHRSPVIDVN